MRTLVLLERIHVTINEPYRCGDGCCTFNDWQTRICDPGEEFEEDMMDLTWLFNSNWEEGVDYKWVDK